MGVKLSGMASELPLSGKATMPGGKKAEVMRGHLQVPWAVSFPSR